MDDGNKTREELLLLVKDLRRQLTAVRNGDQTQGKGSRCQPQKAAAPEATLKAEATASPILSDGAPQPQPLSDIHLKILLIEDNPGDVRLVKEMLAQAESNGLTLEWVPRLSQGLEYLGRGEIDLVLLDLSLPDSHGLETFCKAYTQAPEIPFVLLSGLDDETVAVTAVQNGAQDYLIKGETNGHKLLRAIRYAAERKKLQEDLRQARDELEVRVKERTAELVAANHQLRDEINRREQTEAKQECLLTDVQNCSEELKISNEELRIHAEELRAQNESLNTQAQELEDLTGELDASRSLLEAALEQMPAGVIIAEPSGRIILTNRRAKVIWQRELDSLNDIEQSRLIPVFYPDGRPCPPEKRPLWRALTLGQTVMDEEYLLQQKEDKDLKTTHLRINATPVRDQNGAVIAAVGTYTDITDRKAAQAALRQSEERYRSLVELSPDAILAHAKGKIVFVNQAAVKMFNAAKREDLLGQPVMNIVHPAYQESIQDRIRAVQKHGRVGSAEEKVLRLDGKVVDVESVGSAIMYQNRPAIQVILRDITERMRFREALRAASEKLRATIEASPLAIFNVDHAGIIRAANPATERIFGWRTGELLGRRLPMVPEEQWEGVLEIIGHVWQGQRLVGIEARRRRKDGTWIDVSLSAAPMYDEHGQVTGVVSLAEDITARKQAEVALDRSRAEFEAIFNSISDAIIFADNERRIVLVNPAVTAMFGYQPGEIIGRSTEILYADRADFEAARERYYPKATLGKPGRFEITYRRKNGTLFSAESLASQVLDARGHILGGVGIHRDITARKVAEVALAESQRQTALLANFLENSSQPFVVGFLDGRLGMYNAAYYRLLGYSQKELAGLAWEKDITPPEWRELQAAKLAELLQTGQPVRFEKEYLRKDGSRVPVEIFVHLRREEPGQPAYYYAFVTDITGRKEAEAALKESEARFRAVFEGAAIGIALTDTSGGILTVNPALEKSLGYSLTDLTDKTFTDITHPDDVKGTRYLFQELVAGRRDHYHMEKRYITKDGSVIWVNLTVSLLRDAAGAPKYSVGMVEDITARKEAEASLERERQRLFALLDELPGFIFLHDENYAVRFANRRCQEIFGDPQNQFCYTAFHQRETPCEGCPASEVFKSHSSVEWEQTIPDGRTFHLYKYPFRDMDGTLCVLSLGLDVTARKQAEDDLRKQAQLLDLAHDAIIVRDLEAGITFWSRGAMETYGWTKEQAQGQTSHALLQTTFPVSQEIVEQEVLKRGKWEGELQHTRSDGQVIAVASRWALQRDETGAPKAILEINRDITERKQAEEALRESEARFRQLAENLDDAIMLASADLERLHYISPASERIWGRPLVSLYEDPHSWQDSIVAADREKVRTALKGLRTGDLPTAPFPEFRIQRLDGMVRWIQARFFPIKNKAGIVHRIAGIASDITPRKEVEAVLKWREERLRQTAKMEALGRLAGGVAHDFNNLLTVISGYGELLLADLPEPDHGRQQVQAILKAADQATGVTRQLLAFSRKQVLQPQILDLNRLITSLVEMFSRLVDVNIQISMSLEPQLGAVKADPNHMEQVFMNLMINAMDAMPQGGELRIETANVQVAPGDIHQLPEIAPGAYVVILVADTGIGMNREILSHIFEPFFTTKERGKGTGLGLSMAYGIIKQSGGHILVESSPQQGSSFRIYLPRVARTTKPLESTAFSLTGTRDTGTILLVEDETGVRHVVERMLSLKGYSVITAHDAQEALKISQEYPGPIHLLLTDVAMPGMGGRELAERLISSHPKMNVLFMSGHTEDSMLRHGIKESVINFIQKPFRADQLLRKVGKLLADAKP